MSSSLRINELVEKSKDSKFRGNLDKPDISCDGNNPSCGDSLTMEAKVDGGRFSKVRFTGQGCVISQAAASLLAEFLTGKPLRDILELSGDDMAEMLELDLGPTRMRCATLGLASLRDATKKFLNEQK
ncbi:iron-sulfur cluster assembly scaffold protein [Candidatus Dependentiae bacterium]